MKNCTKCMIKNLCWSSCKVPLLLLGFNGNRIFSRELSKITPNVNFMKLRPVGVELLQADGRTDRHDEVNSPCL
jgi:hypothetical protein